MIAATAPTDVARLGLVVANVMEQSGHTTSAGIVRRMAGLLIEQGAELATLRRAPIGESCRRCGEPVEQKEKGRSRIWCSSRCRQANHRDGTLRDASMVT